MHISSVVHAHLVEENKKYQCNSFFSTKNQSQISYYNKLYYNFNADAIISMICFKMHASPGPLHYGKIMTAESASQPITVRHFTGNDDNNK